jgi:hypothetical protein
MDPYDMPEEFAMLQGLNMDSFTFIQDLVRGVAKLLGAVALGPATGGTAASGAATLHSASTVATAGSATAANAAGGAGVNPATGGETTGVVSSNAAAASATTPSAITTGSTAVEEHTDVGTSATANDASSPHLAYVSAASLLKRAKLMCEDGDYAKANELVEMALGLGPYDAEAYLVALMVEHQCQNEEQLGNLQTDELPLSTNYQIAMRFGSPELTARLATYNQKSSLAYTAAQEAGLQIQRQQQLTKEQEAKRRSDIIRACEDFLNGRTVSSLGLAFYQWRVIHLDEERNRALAITREVIDEKPFHQSSGDLSWAESTLRHWLNDTFYNSFPDSLQSRIEENRYMDNFGIIQKLENSLSHDKLLAMDKDFLLSVNQAQLYFVDDQDRIAKYHKKTVGGG